MFNSLETTDFGDVVVEKASDFIKTDRMRFENLYKIITDYCASNSIMISNADALISDASGAEAAFTETLNVHCTFPYNHAIKIANLICGIGEWVKMRTVVGYREFAVDYDSRTLANIFGLEIQKGVDPRSIILPVDIGNLTYLPPEVEILDVYHKLYSPSEVDCWAEAITVERDLYGLIMKRLESGVFGGDKMGSAHPPKDTTDLQYLKYLFLREFCGTFVKDYVVIGHWAMHAVEASREEDYKMKSSIEKMQVITSIEVNRAIEDIIRFLSRYTNARIASRMQDLHIPKDFRISRHTIYIGVPDKNGNVKDKAFLDVFNCGNFELIPYVSLSLKTKYGSMIKDPQEFNKYPKSRSRKNRRRRGGVESDEFIIKIGNPFVLLRFLFIDLWVIRIIHNMGHLTREILQTKVKYIMHVVQKIKDPSFGLMSKVFGLDYVGVYKDYDISKKADNLKSKMFFPYYPAKELRKVD